MPIVFAVDGGTIVSAIDHKPKTTTRLKRLTNIERNPTVALLADHYADDWDELWWVRADGHASMVDDRSERNRAVNMLVLKYSQYQAVRPAGPVLRIVVGRWSGWRASPGVRP